MIYWLHRLATPLSRALPVWLSYGLCSLFAPWVFLVWREKREHALENMRAVLGDDADPRLVRRMARRAFTKLDGLTPSARATTVTCSAGAAIVIG